MEVLIIGGTGNISARITQVLLQRGAEVTLFNRGSAAVPGARLIRGDRRDHGDFYAKLSGGSFDCVIDMVGYEPQDAESDVRTFAGRCEQFIFCSTVDVFTKPAPNYPITEKTERNPSPSFPYAHKKAAMERIFEAAADAGEFALTVIRPAATYNDASAPIGILNSGLAVMRRIRERKPVILMGDGMSLWASAHRDDVGLAFANAVLNKKTYGRAYNIPGDECMTWRGYYTTIAACMCLPPPEYVTIPADVLYAAAPDACGWCPVNFMYNNIIDGGPAKRDLGYIYTVSWAEGVRRMIAYHDARGGIDAGGDHPAYERLIGLYRAFRSAAAELDGMEQG